MSGPLEAQAQAQARETWLESLREYWESSQRLVAIARTNGSSLEQVLASTNDDKIVALAWALAASAA